MMREVKRDGYTYLGIADLDSEKKQKIKEHFLNRYKSRLKTILKLNETVRRNQTVMVMVVLRYGAEIFKSTVNQINIFL